MEALALTPEVGEEEEGHLVRAGHEVIVGSPIPAVASGPAGVSDDQPVPQAPPAALDVHHVAADRQGEVVRRSLDPPLLERITRVVVGEILGGDAHGLSRAYGDRTLGDDAVRTRLIFFQVSRVEGECLVGLRYFLRYRRSLGRSETNADRKHETQRSNLHLERTRSFESLLTHAYIWLPSLITHEKEWPGTATETSYVC